MGQERGSYLVMLAPPVPAAAFAAARPPAGASRRRRRRHLLPLLPVGSGAVNLIRAPLQQEQQQQLRAKPRRCCLTLVRLSQCGAGEQERVNESPKIQHPEEPAVFSLLMEAPHQE
ncbi:unnamed protein product [Coccothraustes coccothraustes]